MKIFKSREYKRAAKIHIEAQKKIASFTKEQIKYKANDQRYWHWQRYIDEQKIISSTCIKIISSEQL